jgi:hypothetical protein
LLSLQSVVPPLLFHGGVGLVCIGGHTSAPTKPYESGICDSGGVSYLVCARRSCTTCSGGGIRRVVRGVLRVRIRCAIPSISSLPVVVLWLGVASLDSFRDLAYGGLHDPV